MIYLSFTLASSYVHINKVIIVKRRK